MARCIPLLLILIAVPAHAQYPPWSYSPWQDTAPQPSIAATMVDAHNRVRVQVGVPPLIWSDQLAGVAQEWANRLINTGQFSHRPGNRYGENLYAISGAIAAPNQVVAAWANEAHSYDPRSGVCRGVCGHYTQIVWRQTRAVGCAVARDGYREVWACNYDPPGNVIGYRPY
jgi:pathogenesis-related protein 1